MRRGEGDIFYFQNGGISTPKKALWTETSSIEHEVLLEADDASAWVEERREYLAICADPAAPRPLIDTYRRSYTLVPHNETGATRIWNRKVAEKVRYVHSFDGRYGALEDVALESLDDDAKLALVRDLLDAVAYLHSRGLPHLALNSKMIRVSSVANELKLVGAGAGPRLVATKRPFALPEEWWQFNAPETTGVGAMIIQSNLRALLSMDAWSVGVLVCMIISGSRISPFEASPDWTKGILDDRAAVGDKTRKIFSDFASFLRDLDDKANGCLTRHGWLLRVILGLLNLEATDRMTVLAARDIAKHALASRPQFAAAQNRDGKGGSVVEEFGRFRPMMTLAPSGEPFRSLEAMVNIIEGGTCDCVLENRRMKNVAALSWGSGVPYGEIIGYRNRGDGDRWDIFLPGLTTLDPDSPTGLPAVGLDDRLRILRVIGVVLVKGGNHKIAVEVADFPPTKSNINSDVRRFIDAYVASKWNLSRARVRYLEYSGDTS